MVDFTNCKVIPWMTYGGANGNKIAVEYGGDIYMIKFPPSGIGKRTELSYTNSCISEHLASSIFNMFGVKAHETILGTYMVKGKIKIVCACKDFTGGWRKLFDFYSLKNTNYAADSSGGGTELEEIMDIIDLQQVVEPNKLREHFWDMFVVDALLGNFDRHNGNWGFLSDHVSHVIEIAPVYDCGSCLLPQADESIMQKVVSDENELNARIYQFPVSAIRINGRKINYYDYLSRTQNEDCLAALKRVVPRMNMLEVDKFIEQQQGISDLQKEFYKLFLNKRYKIIIRPAYERALMSTTEDGACRFARDFISPNDR